MSSAQNIAKLLRSEILAGSISPGQELRQEELAARFEVSRMPVRDALNLLARDRLITFRPNRSGMVVSFGEQEIEEVYQLRVLLETDALERSFGHIDKDVLQDIKLEMQRCEIEAGTSEFPKADWRFHQSLYAPSARLRQVAMIKELRDVCQMHQAAYSNLQSSEMRWSEDHRAIVEAVEDRDLDSAKSALAAHLREADHQLRGYMKQAKRSRISRP